jgi:DNA repair and recombination protein RAD52
MDAESAMLVPSSKAGDENSSVSCDTSRRDVVNEELQSLLGPEWVSTRKGAGNQTVPYIAGCHAIRLANRVLGYDGWSSEIKSKEVLWSENRNGKWFVAVEVIVRVTLTNSKGNPFREGIGHDEGVMPDKFQAFQKATKSAETDAIKRALREVGDVLGNCLYDKVYLDRIKTVKDKGDVMIFDKTKFFGLKVDANKRKRQSVLRVQDSDDDMVTPGPSPYFKRAKNGAPVNTVVTAGESLLVCFSRDRV